MTTLYQQADGTLTETTPTSTLSRLVPSWATVAPLLQRWQLALIPRADRAWDVLAGFPESGLPKQAARGVAWPDVPQTILEVSQRCEAEQGEGER